MSSLSSRSFESSGYFGIFRVFWILRVFWVLGVFRVLGDFSVLGVFWVLGVFMGLEGLGELTFKQDVINRYIVFTASLTDSWLHRLTVLFVFICISIYY